MEKSSDNRAPQRGVGTGVGILVGCLLAGTVQASSHREAPQISAMPRVDGTDFYMFRSYETNRQDFVTLLANYLPLQDAYGGPNYFDLEDDARYEIHIDNNGDAKEDITFRFSFSDVAADLKVDAGGTMVPVPLKNIGTVGSGSADTANVNARQTFTLRIVRGDIRSSGGDSVTDDDGQSVLRKPVDNIGTKSISDYASYANDHVYDVTIPGCGDGRVFVGQRKEGFAVNLGAIFDLVNLNPLGPPDAVGNTIDDKNVTTLALEVPIACLVRAPDTVIGGWTTALIPQVRLINPRPRFDRAPGATLEAGPFVQVSRLGMPLVNEVVIGLRDKDRFNASEPKDDAQFATYVTNPTLPELLEALFPGTAVAPQLFPRTDLIAAFLTGIDGVNKPTSVVQAEMLRLNTAIEPTPAAQQATLGVLDGDLAGFPHGRRVGDDVVDAELRVAMGALIGDAKVAPNNTAPLTDGVAVSAADFDETFPYLRAPIPGATN